VDKKETGKEDRARGEAREERMGIGRIRLHRKQPAVLRVVDMWFLFHVLQAILRKRGFLLGRGQAITREW
jgi:hypothetical protein